MSARLLEEARAEARAATEAERRAAENEVQSLKARREFLVGDVDQLERFLADQRERLRGAARQIEALCDRVPAGLGAVRPPALSASDDEPGDDTAELFIPTPLGAGAGADDMSASIDPDDRSLGGDADPWVAGADAPDTHEALAGGDEPARRSPDDTPPVLPRLPSNTADASRGHDDGATGGLDDTIELPFRGGKPSSD
jgi:hypothetical protein